MDWLGWGFSRFMTGLRFSLNPRKEKQQLRREALQGREKQL
jgi:hypothetical protein